MIPIVTPEQMRASEQAAVAGGVAEAELMSRAARGIADWVQHRIARRDGDDRPVVGLVGPGNNGADALVALAYLADADLPTAAILVGQGPSRELPISAAALQRVRVLDDIRELTNARLIIDGIYGVAGRAELAPRERELIAAAQAAGAERGIALVAIDVPSGVDALSGAADAGAFCADVTLTIGMPKLGLLRLPAAETVGELVVLPIGLSAPDGFDGPWMVDAESTRRALPRRGAFAHKSSAGAVLVVGGAPNYYGAPRLAAEAAMRVGAGLVGLAVPRSLVPTIAAQLPEAIYKPINDADPRRAANSIRETLNEERFRAVVIGPGLGQDETAKDLLSALFRSVPRRRSTVGFGIPDVDDQAGGDMESLTLAEAVVLDADALNWLAEHDDWPTLLSGVTAILTPHVGELARLTGLEPDQITSDPHAVALDCARKWGQVVVLKCGYSCAATPDGRLFVAPRAPRELATAGTGDVLAGLIGGLLAQGLDAASAAAGALYIGSRAGALAAERRGVLSVIARDVIEATPAVLVELLGPNW